MGIHGTQQDWLGQHEYGTIWEGNNIFGGQYIHHREGISYTGCFVGVYGDVTGTCLQPSLHTSSALLVLLPLAVDVVVPGLQASVSLALASTVKTTSPDWAWAANGAFGSVSSAGTSAHCTTNRSWPALAEEMRWMSRTACPFGSTNPKTLPTR